MCNSLKSTALLILLQLFTFPVAAQHAAHAGKQQRSIKALSEQEVQALLQGEGAGFALPAELNHYPGPRHSLDLRKELKLTAAQEHKIDAIFRDMNQRARRLGKLMVDRERELDRAFASQTVDPASLERLTRQIGSLTAQLRAAHLHAHLETTALLNRDQIRRYDQLRGYSR